MNGFHRPVVWLLFALLLSISPRSPTRCGTRSIASTPTSRKQIDWNALRSAYRPRALAAGDQRAFMDVVRELLANLHDGHVFLRDPGGARIATYQSPAFVNWDRAVWQKYRDRSAWTQGASSWGHGVLDGVPYIVIEGWGATNIRAADFDAAFERYRNAPALIFDVRMNPGGNDLLAFEIAGGFIPATVNSGYVRYRNGPAHTDFGAPTQRTVNPRGPWQYRPNVTLVGDRTAGSTGNPGTFPLAGGWSYTVSRWIEYTADNQVIEDNGISPAVFVAATAGDFASGRDPVIDWALSRLAAR